MKLTLLIGLLCVSLANCGGTQGSVSNSGSTPWSFMMTWLNQLVKDLLNVLQTVNKAAVINDKGNFNGNNQRFENTKINANPSSGVNNDAVVATNDEQGGETGPLVKRRIIRRRVMRGNGNGLSNMFNNNGDETQDFSGMTFNGGDNSGDTNGKYNGGQVDNGDAMIINDEATFEGESNGRSSVIIHGNPRKPKLIITNTGNFKGNGNGVSISGDFKTNGKTTGHTKVQVDDDSVVITNSGKFKGNTNGLGSINLGKTNPEIPKRRKTVMQNIGDFEGNGDIGNIN